MTTDEMTIMSDFIDLNHHLFSKNIEKSAKKIDPIRENLDYGDFISKLEEKLKKLKRIRSDRNHRKS